jgi:hypothetical protein
MVKPTRKKNQWTKSRCYLSDCPLCRIPLPKSPLLELHTVLESIPAQENKNELIGFTKNNLKNKLASEASCRMCELEASLKTVSRSCTATSMQSNARRTRIWKIS